MSKKPYELVIATSNSGKIREIKRALTGLPLRLSLLEDYPTIPAPDECGDSYEDNAIIKATEYAMHTGCWSLADDSGLEVESLQGAPGLNSARFGGPADTDRVELLLSKLTAFKDHQRRARFVCVMAIVDPKGTVHNIAKGICNGIIGQIPAGSGGFGYEHSISSPPRIN